MASILQCIKILIPYWNLAFWLAERPTLPTLYLIVKLCINSAAHLYSAQQVFKRKNWTVLLLSSAATCQHVDKLITVTTGAAAILSQTWPVLFLPSLPYCIPVVTLNGLEWSFSALDTSLNSWDYRRRRQTSFFRTAYQSLTHRTCSACLGVIISVCQNDIKAIGLYLSLQFV